DTMSLYNTIPTSNITRELIDQEVTFSFRARASHNTTSSLMFYFMGSGVSNYYPVGTSDEVSFSLTTEWQTFFWTVKIKNSIENYTTLRFTPYIINIPSGQINNFYLDLCEFKIELGSKATDWNPASEEIETRITTAEAS